MDITKLLAKNFEKGLKNGLLDKRKPELKFWIPKVFGSNMVHYFANPKFHISEPKYLLI